MMRGRRTPHVIGMTACRLTKSAGVQERPSRRADVRHSAVQRPSTSGSASRTRRTSRATSRASRSSATHVPVIHTGINHRAASHEAASTPVALTITSAPCAGAQEVHTASADGNESPRRAAHSGSHRGSRRPRSGNVAAVARLTAHSRCRSAADRERRRGTMTCAASRTAVAPITCVCPSRLARSMSCAIRSSSSSESRSPSRPTSASTTFSGEPSKNVSTRCFTAERRTFCGDSAGRYTYRSCSSSCRTCALVLEHAQLGADGRVRRLSRQRRHHLGDGGTAESMDDVHDFALAPAQGGRFRHCLIL